MVLIEHLPINLLWWNSALFRFAIFQWHGAMGVDLFFAISGFVIARGLLPSLAAARGRYDLGRVLVHFWLRRAFRLLPAAWLWLAIPLWLSHRLGSGSAFGDTTHNLSMTVFSLLNIANFYTADTQDLALRELKFYGPGFVYWSLSLEEQFYLVLPLVTLLFRSWLPLLLLGVVAYQFLVPFTPLTDFTRPGALAVGVLIAIAARHAWYGLLTPRFLSRSVILRIGLLGFGVVVLGLLGVQSTSWKLGVVALISGVLVFAASFDRRYVWPGDAAGRTLAWLGSRSYALYLTHLTAYCATFEIVRRLYDGAPPHQPWLDAVALLVALSMALLAAEATHRCVEKPAKALGRRLTRPAGVASMTTAYGVPT